MKFRAKCIIVAGCCSWMLTLPACSMRSGQASANPVASAPPPAAPDPSPVETATDPPISVPQTQVTLPNPQPIQAEAQSVPKVDSPPAAAPASQPVKPRSPPAAPRAEPRQQTAGQPGPAPPPATASRRRIRPMESAAERGRLMGEITTRQRQVQDNLAKARNRQLSDAEKGAIERIRAFLEQAETALKNQDLQQAAALSNRALLLSQDLNEK